MIENDNNDISNDDNCSNNDDEGNKDGDKNHCDHSFDNDNKMIMIMMEIIKLIMIACGNTSNDIITLIITYVLNQLNVEKISSPVENSFGQ